MTVTKNGTENKSKESEKDLQGKEKKEKEGRSDKRRHLNRKERILPFWAKVKCFSSHILPSFSEVKVYKQKYLNKSMQHMLQAYFCSLALVHYFITLQCDAHTTDRHICKYSSSCVILTLSEGVAQARLGWTRPGWEGWKVYVYVSK